ncbi:calcium homeostasis modulator protein 6-like [Thunnus maccoyii]|uniref:calcium homeostasis modulator protein 6-like n=1 Tax=Thunnus maccoyii TaxID=8240 RepID=UPI001C4D3DE1|nr:calcium homeostasis modulator protein 6-like [Thunnus maccoyii]
MKSIFPKFALKRLNTFLAIIVIFVYKVVIDKDLECTCKNQSRDCILFMVLPFGILFVLHLWVDKRFQRIWRFTCTTCSKTCCKFIWVLLVDILKAAFIGVLWVIFVLLDGDWYVCCQNDGSEQQAQLACKDKNNITPEEKANIAELKSWSQTFGFFVFFFTLFAFAILSTFRLMRCCSPCCNRKILYDKMILEEEENVLKEILRGAAREQLTQEIRDKIKDEPWEECFNAADGLISYTRTRPRLAEQQGEGSPASPEDRTLL